MSARPTLKERRARLDACWRAIYNARQRAWDLKKSLQGGGRMPEARKFKQLKHEAELVLGEVAHLGTIAWRAKRKLPKLVRKPKLVAVLGSSGL